MDMEIRLQISAEGMDNADNSPGGSFVHEPRRA